MVKKGHDRKNGRRNKRKVNVKGVNPDRYLIVCEGEATERNYFKGLSDYLDEKTNGDFTKVKPKKFVIKGIGRDPGSLVNSIQKILNRENYDFKKIFCVFDKDKIDGETFDNVVYKCEQSGFIPIWSNLCFEIWLIAHFENFSSEVSCKKFENKLTKIFQSIKKNKTIKYDKNFEEIFKFVTNNGKVSEAVKRAKLSKQINCSKNPSQSDPHTEMYLVLEEFEEYFT
jgi:ribosomal protein S18